MKNTNTKKISPFSVILYIVSALFFIYGIYMVIYSVNYVSSYGTGSVSSENAIQYIITSTMAYFGFAVTFLMGAYIIQKLTKLELTNFVTHSETSAPTDSFPDMQEIIIDKPIPEELPESHDKPIPEELPESHDKPAESETQSHKPESISSSMIKDIFESR